MGGWDDCPWCRWDPTDGELLAPCEAHSPPVDVEDPEAVIGWHVDRAKEGRGDA